MNKFKADISKLNLDDDFIGVHYRGTDFRLNIHNHPNPIAEVDYFNEIDKILESSTSLKIYLATDDEKTLEKFKTKYGSSLKYFDDVFRSDSKTLNIFRDSDRNFHGFLLGYEVLRDSFVLAQSSYFVHGLSNVAYGAKLLNIAYCKKFNQDIVIDKGIVNNPNREIKRINKDKEYQRKII
jgi:hypothetical protein